MGEHPRKRWDAGETAAISPACGEVPSAAAAGITPPSGLQPRGGLPRSSSPLSRRLPEALPFLSLRLRSRTLRWKSSCLCPSGLLERVVGWWVCAGLITQPPPASAPRRRPAAERTRFLSVALCERSPPPGCSCRGVGGAGGCPELIAEGGSSLGFAVDALRLS